MNLILRRKCLSFLFCFSSLFILFYIIYMNQLNNMSSGYLIEYLNEHDLLNLTMTQNSTPLNPQYKEFIELKLKPMRLCSRNKNSILFAYIMIRVDSVEKRQLIRRTWANSSVFSNLRVAFVIGLSNDLNLNEQLINEHNKYNDLIQGNFLDTYRNLTYKSLTAWKWISSYCSNAKYIVKIDDDLALNSRSLINYFKNNNRSYKKTFFCDFLTDGMPHRDKSSKWYVKDQEYNYRLYRLDRYPTFCLGPSYTFTSDLVTELFKISFYVKFFWLEDVYTGLIASKIRNINYIRFTNKYISLTEIVNQPNNEFILVRNVLTDEQLSFAMKYLLFTN